MSQWGSPEHLPRTPPATADPPPRRAALFLRGTAGAFALGAYTIVGLVGAVLALLPAAVRPSPRGRPVAPAPAGDASLDASGEPLPG